MKSALALVFLSTVAFASHGIVHRHRCTSELDTNNNSTSGGWGQKHSGTASFTEYSGCAAPCKLFVYFRGSVLHGVHADRDVLSQRVAYQRLGTRLRSTRLHLVPTRLLVMVAGAASR
jgi:hypothetical protein